jgi:hypothetical protein
VTTPFEQPNSAGCRDRFEKAPCRTDDDLKGVCTPQRINTPDFSQPGPPKFNEVEIGVCVALPTPHPFKDYPLLVVVALVVVALVLFNLFRRRTLSDYQ